MFQKRRQNPERCEICRKFLTLRQLDIGYCILCARKEILNIKKSLVIRVIVSIVLILLVFSVSYYARNRAIAAEHGNMSIPIGIGGHITINGHAFERMFEPTEGMELRRIIFFFFASFGAKVSLRNDKYKSKTAEAQLGAARIEGAFAMGSIHSQESAGLFFMEMFLTVISGPFFLFYRPYRIMKLSKYIQNSQD